MRPTVVRVTMRHELEAEAFVALIGRDARFLATRSALTHADVVLADVCPAADETSDRPPTVCLAPAEGSVAESDCCRRVSRQSSIRSLKAALADAAGQRTGAGRPRELEGLSEREIDVLTLVGYGLSVPQCATELDLAESTVGNHKYRLMKKLRATSSLQLLRIAVRNGLAPLDES